MADCTLIADFAEDGAHDRWFPVNDTVMGGRSDGAPRFEDGAMVFEGVLRTRGGGFASVRLPMTPGAMAGAATLRVTGTGDGRAYAATFRTDATVGPGRSVSFSAPIEGLPEGGRGVGTADLSVVKAGFRGRPVPGATFDPARVAELGVILADGRDGPFRLAVRRIEACGPRTDP